jgi:hypothetical protein
MGYLIDSETWVAQIYQLETTDPVLGGAGGISNQQPQELANRTAKIKAVLAENSIFIDDGDFAYAGQNIIKDATFDAAVADGDMVYYNDSQSKFYKAIADGTDASKAIGIADVTNSKVITAGLVDTALSYNAGDTLYLSASTAGVISDTASAVAVGKYIYDGIIYISPLGTGATGADETTITEKDMYQDLLDTSVYDNMTMNTFDAIDTDDPLIDNSTDMDFDATAKGYDFTAGEFILSTDLVDPLLSGMDITECMVSIDYTDSGTPTIEATADGGSNWETVTNNSVHTFTDVGTDLRIRFTGGGTGTVLSWAVLYKPNPKQLPAGASRTKYITFYNEGNAVDEETIIDGMYFDNTIGINKITLHAKTAPTGANLTVDILKDGAEQSKIATLTDGSTYEKTSITTEYYSPLERFGLKIKSIGSGVSGAKLTAIVNYYDIGE